MTSRLLARLVPALLLLVACCPLYFALYIMSVYHRHGMSSVAVVTAGEPSLLRFTLYLVAALVYVRVPAARLVLQLLAIIEASISIRQLTHLSSFLGSWNVLHGNILAVSAWEAVGLCLVGVLALSHLISSLPGKRTAE